MCTLWRQLQHLPPKAEPISGCITIAVRLAGLPSWRCMGYVPTQPGKGVCFIPNPVVVLVVWWLCLWFCTQGHCVWYAVLGVCTARPLPCVCVCTRATSVCVMGWVHPCCVCAYAYASVWCKHIGRFRITHSPVSVGFTLYHLDTETNVLQAGC